MKQTVLTIGVCVASIAFGVAGCATEASSNPTSQRAPELRDPDTHAIVGVRDPSLHRLEFASGFSVAERDTHPVRMHTKDAVMRAFTEKRAASEVPAASRITKATAMTAKPKSATTEYCWYEEETSASGQHVLYTGCCDSNDNCWSYFESESDSGSDNEGASEGGGGGGGGVLDCEDCRYEED